jgi:hypothetical protein
MRKSVLLVSAFGIAGAWSANATAEGGCPPFGYCAAPSRQYNTYSELRTDYVVRYRTVRVSTPQRPARYG